MAKQKTNSSGNSLKDTAREIGSKLGEVHAKARRMVEGAKAAVTAGRAALSGKPKKAKTVAKKAVKKKSSSARPRKTK
jgi:hypothetical protein